MAKTKEAWRLARDENIKKLNNKIETTIYLIAVLGILEVMIFNTNWFFKYVIISILILMNLKVIKGINL